MRILIGNPDSIHYTKVCDHESPKSGWETFINKLFDLQVLTLPDMRELHLPKQGWMDGEGMAVEISTKNAYRFYTYFITGPPEYKTWQTDNINFIFEYVADQFGFKYDNYH